MKVSEILKKNEVTISCEIFPPKQGAQLQNYKDIAAEIAKLKPAYISCTYGATGGTSDYTVEIADAINSYGVPAIAHLTCVSSTREKVHTVISELKERGIENILALRGDIPTNTDFPLPDQYHHAIELIREIKEQPNAILIIESIDKLFDKQSNLYGTSTILKQELAKGGLLLLCTASIDGYTKNIETDKEFVTKLEKITLEEPNANLCLRIERRVGYLFRISSFGNRRTSYDRGDSPGQTLSDRKGAA